MNLLIMLKIFDFRFKPARKKLKHATVFAGMNIAVSFSQFNEERSKDLHCQDITFRLRCVPCVVPYGKENF